ncbi:RHS repeat-associated core domain-containing protein [Desulfogranum japonicum]|uniref:RHS repeat-associated core domain-containing protein n=1 Tax=Desulfogranum japonicum TaxID=231447 RepID=UPI0004084A1B|nr:RHS repeat-associated core domain-containing protein [Desulfogranum japonicum]
MNKYCKGLLVLLFSGLLTTAIPVDDATAMGGRQVRGTEVTGGGQVHGQESHGTGVHGTGVNGTGVYGTGVNGTGVNGIQIDGVDVTGDQVNGEQIDGVDVTGDQVNGEQIDGVEVSGDQVSGVQIDGVEVSGDQVSGTQINGVEVSGEQISGDQINGLEVSGDQVGGVQIDGVEISGAQIDGLAVDGTQVAGQEVGGVEVTGVQADGTGIDGAQVSGAAVDGTEVGGTAIDGLAVSGNEVGGTEISGQDVSGTEVTGVGVDGSSVSGAEVTGTGIDGTEVGGVAIDGSTVSGSEVDGTRISGKDVGGAEVTGVGVDGSSVSGAEVTGTGIDGTEVGGVAIDGTSVSGNEVAGTEISGQSVSGSEVTGVGVDGSSVSGAEVAGTGIDGAEVGGVAIDGSSVTGSEVGGTRISGQNVSGMEVAGVGVDGTTVSGTEVTGTGIEGTQVGGTGIDGSAVSGEGVSGTGVAGEAVDGSGVSGTEVTGVDIDGVEVDGLNIDGVSVTGEDVSGIDIDGIQIDGTDVDGLEIDGEGVDGSGTVDGQEIEIDLEVTKEQDGKTAASASKKRQESDAQGYVVDGNSPSMANLPGEPVYSISGLINNGTNELTTFAGDPVNMVTGNMYHAEQDLYIPGRGGLPIAFVRSYNSRNPEDGPLGFGWTHSFNHKLRFYGVENGLAKVSWLDGTGNEKFFSTSKHNHGNIKHSVDLNNPQGTHVIFRRLANGTFRIQEKNGLAYIFESVQSTEDGGQKAKLLSIQDRNGNRMHLEYVGIRLTLVADDLGRELTFSYIGSRIYEIKDFSGRRYQYDYDQYGNLVAFRNPLAISSPVNQPPLTYSYYTGNDGEARNHAMKSYVLPKGNGMEFHYHPDGRVSKHIDALGRVEHFTYDDQYRVTTQENSFGQKRQYFFTIHGMPSKIVDENNRQWIYTYDPKFPLQRITTTDPAGHTTSYTYDTSGNVTAIQHPNGATETFSSFTVFHQPQKYKDVEDNYTVYKYDTRGNLLEEVTLRSGIKPIIPYTTGPMDFVSWSLYTYDEHGNLRTTKQVADGRKWTGPFIKYVYDKNDLYLTAVSRHGDSNKDGKINAADPVERKPVQYDSLGRVVRGLDGSWYTTEYAYDSLGRVVRGSDAQGLQRQYYYDVNGNVIEERLQQNDTIWARKQWQYDAVDRITQLTLNSDQYYTIGYDDQGHINRLTDPDGYSLDFAYDNARQEVQVTNPVGEQVTLQRDSLGRPLTFIDANGSVTSYIYENQKTPGRYMRKTFPLVEGQQNARAVVYEYDRKGRVIAQRVIGSHGKSKVVKLIRYSEQGKPIRIVGALTADGKRPVTRYIYNLLGQLEQVRAGVTAASAVDPSRDDVQLQMRYTYDDFGRVIRQTNILGQSKQFVYDIHSNLVQSTNENGQVTTFTYGYGHQLLGRESEIELLEIKRNPLGQPITVESFDPQDSSTLVRYTYEYDQAHRLSREIDSRGWELAYNYSPGGMLQSVTDGQGNQTTYSYDMAKRLSRIWTSDQGVVSFTYDPGGRLIEKMLPTGVSTRYTYYADDKVRRVVHGQGTKTVFQQSDYTYDGYGNVDRYTENVGGNTLAYSYGYDELNRLLTVSGGDPDQDEQYSYDALGNRISRIVGTLNPQTFIYQYDKANQLLQVRNGSERGPVLQAFVYDQAGNLIEHASGGNITRSSTHCDGEHVVQYGYDALNRLTEVSQAGSRLEKYFYDPAGHRIGKTIDGVQHHYRYSGDQLYAEYIDQFNTPAARYTRGVAHTSPMMRHSGDSAYYYHHNGLGSVLAMSGTAGKVKANQRFDVWGNRLEQHTGETPGFGFTGGEPDNTGLIYFQARYYDPSIGRFTQRDPIGLAGGINTYAYVGNNPGNAVDPSGLLAQQSGGWWQEGGQSYFDSTLAMASGLTTTVSVSAVSEGNDGMDLSVLLDSDTAWWEKGLSGISLADTSMHPSLFYYASGSGGVQTIPAVTNAASTGKAAMQTLAAYKNLRKVAEAGQDTHQIGRKTVMKQLVAEAASIANPSILVPKRGYTGDGLIAGVDSGNTSEIATVLAENFQELRRIYPDIPNISLWKLLELK